MSYVYSGDIVFKVVNNLNRNIDFNRANKRVIILLQEAHGERLDHLAVVRKVKDSNPTRTKTGKLSLIIQQYMNT